MTLSCSDSVINGKKIMVTFQDAKEVTRSIVKALDPLSVILFGSVARDGKGGRYGFADCYP